MGPCVTNLTIGDDDQLLLSIEDWAAQKLGESGGTLTVDGRLQLDAAATDLLGVTLEEVYGCPDCDDGGASRIDLRRDGETSSHAYEFSAPPPVLVAADGLVGEIIQSLRDCSESELLTLNEDCVPFAP